MHISQIDANLLVVLDALLAESNVTRAAKRVGLSQSAMSHALGRLRDHLGDPLLVRAGRRMVLTPKAERLAPRIRHIVEEMNALLHDDEGFDPAAHTHAYRLHTTDHIQLVLLPDLDRALAEQAPGIDLHIRSITPHSSDELRRGELDLAIGIFDDAPPDLSQQPLFADRFVCLMRKDHPAAGSKLTLDQYAALPHLLVAPRGEPRGLVDRQLAERGYRRRVARAVPHFLVAPFLVADSDYILTVSERLANTFSAYLDLHVTTPPLPLESYTLYSAWHRRHDNDPAHRWLRETILQVASALPPLGPEGRRSKRSG